MASELQNLIATTTPVSTDIGYVVVDPTGTPLDRQVTLSNFSKALIVANIPNAVDLNTAQTLTGKLVTLGVASTTTGVLTLKNSTNNNNVIIQSGVTSASYAMILPLAVAGAGEVLTDVAGDGVLSWETAGGGATFGDILAGTTGNGIAINYASAQATGTTQGFIYGNAFNTNSSFDSRAVRIDNEQNAGSGYNTGIYLINKSTETASGDLNGAGFDAFQSGAGGTLVRLQALTDLGSSTKLLEAKLSNSQSASHTVLTSDLGTSAQGHIGHLINAKGNSTSQVGLRVDTNNTTGKHIELLNIYGGVDATIGVNAGSTRRTFIDILDTSGSQDALRHFKAIDLVFAGSTALQDRVNTFVNIDFSQTHTFTSTATENFDLCSFKRTNVMNNASGTHVAQGAVGKFENVATQTSGTLTDTVVVGEFVQSANSTGVPILVTQNAVVSTNFKKCADFAGFTIWISDGTTAEGALTGVEGDICLNGGTGAGQTAYCDASGTNWTDM